MNHPLEQLVDHVRDDPGLVLRVHAHKGTYIGTPMSRDNYWLALDTSRGRVVIDMESISAAEAVRRDSLPEATR